MLPSGTFSGVTSLDSPGAGLKLFCNTYVNHITSIITDGDYEDEEDHDEDVLT